MTRKEYKDIEKILMRFYSNYRTINEITNDIVSLESAPINEIKTYYISNTVLNKVILLDSNSELKQAVLEYKAVLNALETVNTDAQNIFLSLYIFKKSKWNTQYELGISDRTFERRKAMLIYETKKQLKKLLSKSWRIIGG